MSRRILQPALIMLFAVATAVFSTGALAWGPEGHAIVADIATLHLTPRTLAQVRKLLALEGHRSLDQVASWPDEIRRDQPETGPWHYVDIPLAATQYSPRRDCRHGDCVVSRIPHFAKILGNRAATPKQRLRALKFLVHFVGDIHQPLHTEDHHDKGGNEVPVIYFGHRTSLHAIWDSAILEQALHLHTGPDYSFDHALVWKSARRLNRQIGAAERARWAPPMLARHLLQSTVQWAEQSHALARQVAYPALPAHPVYGWSDTYQAKAWPVVERQLERAGIRLAAVLNGELG